MFEVTIDPVGQPDVFDALTLATRNGDPVTLRIDPPWVERRFEPGDRVQVPFDDGPGMATVIGTVQVHGEGRCVRIKYGPGAKYTTTLPAGAVTTTNTVEHPGSVKVVSHG